MIHEIKILFEVSIIIYLMKLAKKLILWTCHGIIAHRARRERSLKSLLKLFPNFRKRRQLVHFEEGDGQKDKKCYRRRGKKKTVESECPLRISLLDSPGSSIIYFLHRETSTCFSMNWTNESIISIIYLYI